MHFDFITPKGLLKIIPSGERKKIIERGKQEQEDKRV